MFCAILFLLMGEPRNQVHREWTDREAFHRAIQRIEDGWTKEGVLGVLGTPHDIWPASDSSSYVTYGDEVWCYGTNGHHTMPTLGRVAFRDDKVLYIVGKWGSPPAKTIISESELVRLLRTMYRRPQRSDWDPRNQDPLRLIAVANALIPLGKDKALAVMKEYERLGLGNEEWLFWLARVVFQPKEVGGSFAVPHIGAMVPPPPSDLSTWPTYPLVLVDDVPILLYKGAQLGGVPEPFRRYAERDADNWRARSTMLVPPADPFGIYEKVLGLAQWPFGKVEFAEVRLQVNAHEDASLPLLQILKLVRTAFRPIKSDEPYNPYPGGLSFEQLRAEYLLAGPRWDDKQQLYVRRDGSHTPDSHPEYSQHSYTFQGVPGLKLELVYGRETPHSISYLVHVEESGDARIAPAIIVVRDAKTDRELHWMALNQDYTESWTNDKSAILTAPPHKPFLQGGQTCSSGFPLRTGERIQFVVMQANREYPSPIFAP